ncbi:MAG: CDP-glycerol glycerophosphotransferase family protein [bacterium]
MKCILYIAKLYSIPIFKPLVEYLEKEKYQYAFYTSEKVKAFFPYEWDKAKLLPSIKEVRLFNADFVICPGNFVDFRIPGIKVQIFHGLGVEKESHYKIRHFFDLYLTSGPLVTKRFNTLKEKNNYFEVIETGWLKIDYILKYDMRKFKAGFRIPDNKKIILYAPTGSSKMQSGTEMLNKIDDTIAEDEFWIIKFHEFMDKEVIEKFKQKNNKNIHVVDDFDITPYLYIADIMISDTSSVIYEFMCLKKPVITINTLSRKDKGLDVESINQVRKALDKIKHNPRILNGNIEKHLKEVNPYLDGNISKNTVNALEQIKRKGSLPRKGKPLNLFRKMQVIYHSIFRKGYLR